jgi:hypothetical protein
MTSRPIRRPQPTKSFVRSFMERVHSAWGYMLVSGISVVGSDGWLKSKTRTCSSRNEVSLRRCCSSTKVSDAWADPRVEGRTLNAVASSRSNTHLPMPT